MHCTLTIVRYPKRYSIFGFLSMAVFHMFLRLRQNISFYKLMGCGKNGTFDKTPDLQQWALLAVFSDEAVGEQSTAELYGKRIDQWWKRFHCEVWTIALNPLEGHGAWDRKQSFGTFAQKL